MSENKALYLGKSEASPCYFGFWRGLQDSGDGRTSFLDSSGKNRPLLVGADTSYATATANAGYATITGAPSGANKALATADVFAWDMFAGQSLLIAATIKAAAPGATAHIFNARGGANDVKGFALTVDSTGKPSVIVRDTSGASFVSGVPTDVLTDSTDHQVIVAINGTSKRLWGWKDGALWSNINANVGTAITATAGTTQGDDPARWGAIGNFAEFAGGTWVNGANLLIRDMHALVMPYWPANIATIVAELVKNPQRRLSARLLPATANG